jgi:regulator of nucleoside diphosphate kinase
LQGCGGLKINIGDYANLALLALPPALRAKLERAQRVSSTEVPPDVATMQSRVLLTDLGTGCAREVALVYPAEADAAAGKLSVLDPLGAELLAARVGEVVGGLRVAEIRYQPERWMRIHLVVRD